MSKKDSDQCQKPSIKALASSSPKLTAVNKKGAPVAAKLPVKEKQGPPQDCTQLQVCLNSSSAYECFPLWLLTKTAVPDQQQPCYNAGVDEVVANYTITVTKPANTVTVCWNVNFTISNGTGAAVTISQIQASLTHTGMPGFIAGPYSVTLPSTTLFLPNGQSKCLTFAVCSPITAACNQGGSYSVFLQAFTIECGELDFDNFPPLLTDAQCQDTSCYILTDTATVTPPGGSPSAGAVFLTSFSPLPVAPACSDIQAIMSITGGGFPFELDDGVSNLLICPDCFPPPDSNGNQTVTIGVQVRSPPGPCGTTIDNTAVLTKVVANQNSSAPVCPPNSTPVTSISGSAVCISTQACDIITSQPPPVTPPCVSAAVCVTTSVDCKEIVCACKQSTVLADESQVQYDITFNTVPPTTATCTFTPTIFLNACPGTYTAVLTDTSNTILAQQTFTDICPTVTSTPQPCATCDGDVPPVDCTGVSLGPISFSAVEGESALTLVIYEGPDTSGLTLTTAAVCVPSQPQPNVCIGDCVQFLCPPAGNTASCPSGCVFVPSFETVEVTQPTGSDPADQCTRYLILAVLVGPANAGPSPVPNCAPLLDTPVNGILQCNSDGTPVLVNLPSDVLDLLLANGLHYTIQIPVASASNPQGCCGTITVQNTFKIINSQPGDTSCDPTSSLSHQIYSLGDPVALPPCCAPPVVTSTLPNISLTVGAQPIDYDPEIAGSGFTGATVSIKGPTGLVIDGETITVVSDNIILIDLELTLSQPVSAGSLLTFTITTICGTTTVSATINPPSMALKSQKKPVGRVIKRSTKF